MSLMESRTAFCGFIAMDAAETAALRGGIDKQAQDALYMIGYAIGVITKVFVSIYTLIKTVFSSR